MVGASEASENLFTIRDDAERAQAKHKKAKQADAKEKLEKERAIKRSKVEDDVRVYHICLCVCE